MRAGKFSIHDFVAMPNHLHVLVTIPGTMTIEKAVQLIKGTFSFRAKKELGFNGEIWQRGFSDVRVTDKESFREHQMYIDNNPVKAGLAASPLEYSGGSAHLKNLKRSARDRG
jgi:putative transposase